MSHNAITLWCAQANNRKCYLLSTSIIALTKAGLHLRTSIWYCISQLMLTKCIHKKERYKLVLNCPCLLTCWVYHLPLINQDLCDITWSPIPRAMAGIIHCLVPTYINLIHASTKILSQFIPLQQSITSFHSTDSKPSSQGWSILTS